MKIQCLTWVTGILLISTACYQPVERPEQEVVDDSVGGSKNSYPIPEFSTSSYSLPDDTSNNDWNCGTEWVLLKDLNNSYFYVEIPRMCDPLADIYKGCPAPNNI
jgi:hypothetical protein